MNSRRSLILLIQPWIEDFYYTDCRIQPVGLAYLAASIQKSNLNCDVQIYDALSGGEKKSIPLPKEFHYLKPYYGSADKSPFSLFHQYYRFGKNEIQISGDLRKYKNLFLIGISSLFTPYYRQSLEMARICKDLFPGVPVVMGGSHATLHPETLLKAKYNDSYLCDFIIEKEAEAGICDLIEVLQDKRRREDVSNLIYLKNIKPGQNTDDSLQSGELVRNSVKSTVEVSDLIPDFSSLDRNDYVFNRQPMSFLITARSCPHRCSFCSIHSVFGNQFRVRKPESVLREIQLRYEEGIRHFDIEDDNFTANKKNAAKILEGIIELDLPVTLSAMNGLSYHSLDEELLRLMKKAGFQNINLSLVSSDRDVLSMSERPHTVEKFEIIVNASSNLGMPVTAYYILGMPGQTISEMAKTLLFLAGLRCLIGASPFYFTPGSPIHHRMKNDRSIRLASSGKDPYFSARLTAMDLENNDFSRDDIYTLFRLTRLINYVKEGIDRGLEAKDAWFIPAEDAFFRGRWFFESKSGKRQSPFSDPVLQELMNRKIRVRGHRTEGWICF